MDRTRSLCIFFADCFPDQNSGAGSSSKVSWTIDLVSVWLGHKNNFSKINWNPWQLIKITIWNFYLVNLWSWFEPKDLKLSRACDFLSAFSVPDTCANLDELGNTDNTKTAHGINSDVSFTLHNILPFKSIEDKQITSLSWHIIEVWQKHDKATVTVICAYL